MSLLLQLNDKEVVHVHTIMECPLNACVSLLTFKQGMEDAWGDKVNKPSTTQLLSEDIYR